MPEDEEGRKGELQHAREQGSPPVPHPTSGRRLLLSEHGDAGFPGQNGSERKHHSSGQGLLSLEGPGSTAADAHGSRRPSIDGTRNGAGATGLLRVEAGLGEVGRTQNLLVKSARGTGAAGRTGIPRALLKAAAHPREGLLWAGCPDGPALGSTGGELPARPHKAGL